ncbi:MAG: KEOPS complex kinase/ATPase Bud32 [Nitrososphaerota archaeon]|nr:KEOPS complex kinase/ATPase Bud32 [Nitrososphaerota archaeon]
MEILIKRGAEASLYLTEYFGEKVIVKRRDAKTYRNPRLDEEIRKHRTLQESSFLIRARESGVPTPLVYFVDTKRGEIIMQYIEGRRMKEILDAESDESIDELCIKLGQYIAKLHKRDLIHGDLTTSNFILSKDGHLVLIDFGLSFFSQRLEDKAVDLHLIKEVLTSAHKNSRRIFMKILEGYSSVVGEDMVKVLLGKIREIELRGRYTRV